MELDLVVCGKSAEIEQLIIRMARDNPRWGYTPCSGA